MEQDAENPTHILFRLAMAQKQLAYLELRNEAIVWIVNEQKATEKTEP
jgi:hypothetical protein